MDIEFHYYLTAFLAHRAGFSEADACVVAYSSQYVDENDVCFSIKHRSSPNKSYQNFISQTMNILKPKLELMRIYPIFHFLPGEPDARTARRRDGKRHILNTTPNNEMANDLMAKAVHSDRQIRLYQIGIAAHAYVDTWAHQNFIGWYDSFNQVGSDLKPNIGHADGEHHPDWVSHCWIDNRLVDGEVNNRSRFLSASEALFRWLCQASGRQEKVLANEVWPAVFLELCGLMGPTYTGNHCRYEEERLERYEAAMPWLPSFDERMWFEQAIDSEVIGSEDSQDGILARFTFFQDHHYWGEHQDHECSHWFRFQEAVKTHERLAINLLKSRFEEMDLDVTQV